MNNFIGKDIPPSTDEELERMKANRRRRKKLQQAS